MKFNKNRMEFNTFQQLCHYCKLAYVYRDDHTRMEPVCKKKNRRPVGHSWSICDEEHCPYFGIRIVGDNSVIYKQGEEIGKCERIEATVISNPEDYE